MADKILQENNTLYAPVFSDRWTEQFLYPLAEWLNGMAFKDFEFTSGGRPVVKIAEIKNGVSGQTRFTNEEYDEKYLLKKGDMLFCWSGQPQTSIDVFWWDGPDGWLNQHIFKVTSKLENKYFFFYLLKYLKPNFVQIAINKQTTGLGHVTKGDLERFIVKLPKPDEQRAIAEVLSSLDNKIDLLREQNNTLEVTAQLIFKEWFVNFNFPGTTGKMIDSELGEIPEGWKVYELRDLFNFKKGKKPGSTSEIFISGFLPQILIDTLDGGRVIFADSKNTVLSKEEDLVMVMDGASSGRIEFGYSGIIGSTLSLLDFKKECKAILYFFLKNKEGEIKGSTTGSAIPHTDKEKIYQYLIALPYENLEKLESILNSFRKKVILNRKSIKTLSALRDTLLPKMMNGEVRVKGFNN